MDLSAKRYVKGSDLLTRDIAGEVIIVPIRDRVGDLDSIYTLNEVGALIWKLIDGQTPVSRILEAVQREYEVAAVEAEKDLSDFLGSLEAEGLIRPSRGSRG